MKKIVKIVAIVVAVVLVAAFVAPMLLRGKIAQIVKREANEMFDARVDFEKLDISLLRHFPRASLDLKGLTVVGAGPFEGDTIVAANRISVVVNPMSLFGDDGFEVTKVILAEPALHAHKLADGKVNWDIVKASGEEPAAGEVSSEEGSSSFSLSIRDFRISDATIRYEDDSTGMRFSTAPLSLRLRGDMSADQTDLDQTDLDLRLTAGAVRLVSGGIPLLSDAEAELDAVIAADLKNNRFTFSRNRLRLNATWAPLPAAGGARPIPLESQQDCSSSSGTPYLAARSAKSCSMAGAAVGVGRRAEAGQARLRYRQTNNSMPDSPNRRLAGYSSSNSLWFQ